METDVRAMMASWHDFYELIGTASATLIGLMFVAASIAAGFLNEAHRAGMRVFFTPTIAHFTSALAICILITVPTLNLPRLGAALLACGIIGLAYAASVWWSMNRGLGQTVALDDQLWYALAPTICFILLAGSGVLLLFHHLAGIELVAGVLVLLLLLGIRNAWDIMIWVVLRPPSK